MPLYPPSSYQGPEVYPPTSWVSQCEALVPNPHVSGPIFEDLGYVWWLHAWDQGMSPAQAVAAAIAVVSSIGS